MACQVQRALGLPEDRPALDVNAACSGFIYGTAVARGLLATLGGRYALVVGSEALSRLMNQTDRSTCVLFGDGAGAAIFERCDAPFAILKQKVDAAQGFINAVKQRQHTLLTTMQAIIDIQRPFFLEGDESLLKPMILKDVAERSGLDISTISRVSNSKYVQTNYGIYSLKFFFSDGYTTEDGEELSVREIKRILKECVDTEEKEKPYTDDELA